MILHRKGGGIRTKSIVNFMALIMEEKSARFTIRIQRQAVKEAGKGRLQDLGLGLGDWM